MALKLYTAQYSYKFSDRVDTTVKSGKKAFAPTWDIVNGVKDGTLTPEQYTDRYYDMMRKSWRQNKDVWLELLSREEATIVCFCPYRDKEGNRVFCHRHLLKDMLVACGAVYMGER